MLTLYQATVLARQDPDFNDIYRSIKGLIFLGTPHRGLRPSATTFLGNLQLSGKLSMVSVNSRLLKSLKEDSNLLIDISSRFVHCLEGLEIVTFCEQRPTGRIGLVVPVSDVPYDLDQV